MTSNISLGQFLAARISRVDASLQQRAHLEVAITRIRDAQFGIPSDLDVAATSAEPVLISPGLLPSTTDLDEQAAAVTQFVEADLGLGRGAGSHVVDHHLAEP